jgi:hypothetical protein
MADLFYSYREPGDRSNTPPLLVRFEETTEQNAAITQATGIATFDHKLVALVSAPGARSEAACEVERTLPDGTVKRHPLNSFKYGEAAKLYKAGKEQTNIGTPLEHLPGINPAYVLNLKARGIHSIEMLHGASDNLSGELMGYRHWKEKAKDFIEVREKEAPKKHLEAELKQRDDTIANLQRQLDELVSRLGEPEKRKPGRPPKAEVAQAA